MYNTLLLFVLLSVIFLLFLARTDAHFFAIICHSFIGSLLDYTTQRYYGCVCATCTAHSPIQVNGLDVAAYQPSWLKKRTAVVAQEPVLFAGTIRDNILYARSRSRRSLNQAQHDSPSHDGSRQQGSNNSSNSSNSSNNRSSRSSNNNSSNGGRRSNNCLRLPEHSTAPLSSKKQAKLHVEAVKAAKKAHAADFIESLPMGYDSQVLQQEIQSKWRCCPFDSSF